MTDTERIDWLESKTMLGYCPALVYDDDGLWAVSFSGSQRQATSTYSKSIKGIWTNVKPEQWRPSIRKAIDAAVEAEEET